MNKCNVIVIVVCFKMRKSYFTNLSTFSTTIVQYMNGILYRCISLSLFDFSIFNISYIRDILCTSRCINLTTFFLFLFNYKILIK